MFEYELAPLPISRFDEFGLMRKTSNTTITSMLIVPYNDNLHVDVQLGDGNELMYHTSWTIMGRTVVLYHNLVKAAEHRYPVN